MYLIKLLEQHQCVIYVVRRIRKLTQHSTIAVAHGTVTEAIVLHVVGLVREISGTRFGLQQQVGCCCAVHDVLLKRAGVPHHLSIVHTKISCREQ